ncbi:tRNA uridine 5-carboxymethylaminomethyl modification enzyme mnmG [Desulfurobacterium thermolithotrophum DSM 11699]|uniref:tRNA uridine 5-carboxymethylaminomethyl modification enzyme MnmG n=1 Tax=Desulfurobacterium thermolithotrophum (strain DSM 11699 / BSA) TaxID=868864 RepID=F0S082_DESTD|nr:tRNA uridine-5-carboxymethylaminomethyl(34) synthesis enzyme MnmG [Desulfurobacterium thermolithotrophum]ADY73761.1 tRNA uridine 5-carboxymethylaminomethyl modification enzyme mnmG [Desulfurobacterium thermolithotrophum DSM 11699]
MWDGIYDVIVVGAGHAGCEAALAAARMGCKTALFTVNVDKIAEMSCNPAIGGVAKGTVVREIDALGGEMAKNIDETGIQFRILNRRKGPAVRAPRAQADKYAYRDRMRKIIENTPNLEIVQQIVDDIIVEDGKVKGVVTHINARYGAKAVVVTAGTFLKGKIFIGFKEFEGGRMWEPAANKLSNFYIRHGFKVARLKTGTPVRLDGTTIDFSKMERQDGDEPPPFFSYWTEPKEIEQIPCWLTYTTPETHRIIKENLHRSPMYGECKLISGVGVRYCPSIEDKIVKFPDKERHHVFVEPEGRNTVEFYPNGTSTSLPFDVQEKIIRSIPGLENAKIIRPAYAIEYDFVDPTHLYPTLETKIIKGLFNAGQINGTTGYEEAAGQGIVAGINAALYALNKDERFILGRDEAYIGVMIDDLVNKGVREPYRLFTSRAEYRLLIRYDNADYRLAKYGYRFGLLTREQYERVKRKYETIKVFIEKLKEVKVKPEVINPVLEKAGSTPLKESKTVYEVLKRPEVKLYEILKVISFKLDIEDRKLLEEILEEVEIEVKYEGYIKRQLEDVKKFRKLENVKIPQDFDYSIVPISTEEKQKLKEMKPLTLGQAARLEGIRPASIPILAIYIEKWKRGEVKLES